MTTAGHTRPTHGTRFELVLERADEDRARYRCAVLREQFEWTIAIALRSGESPEAAVVDAPEGLPPDALAQLLSLARVIAKRSDETPWPRRILRWRQPGVR
jgi:hypothetical protein